MHNSSGPAFVVLNDELPDRVGAREIERVDHVMHEWMDTLWHEKVFTVFSDPILAEGFLHRRAGSDEVP